MISGGLVPSIQNNPVYSLPHLYISGMNLSVASPTILAIAPGQARDMNDTIDMCIGFPNLQGNVSPSALFLNYMPPLLLNSSVVGANGLDQGVLTTNTSYFIYLIGDSRGYNQTAGLISLYSNAYPLIPEGYDSYLLLAGISTNGATQFDITTVHNYVSSMPNYLQPPVSVLSNGNAVVFTGVDLNAAIPLGITRGVIAYLNVIFTPASAGDYVQLRPTSGGTGTTGLYTIVGNAAGVPQQQYATVACGVNGASHTSIDYLVSSASDGVSISVAGYNSTRY